MIGYYLLPDETIVQYEGTEDELVDKTRQNVWRQTDEGIQSIPNDDYVASQVFWTRDALESLVMSQYTQPDLNADRQPVYGESQAAEAKAKVDEMLVIE